MFTYKSRNKYLRGEAKVNRANGFNHYTKREWNTYKCNSCSKVLFKQKDIIFHQKPKNEKTLCKFYFIEKQDWVHCDPINPLYKLMCPECKNVVGEAKLTGLMCSCGFLQNPSFRIQKN
jgi:hypothetical protein